MQSGWSSVSVSSSPLATNTGYLILWTMSGLIVIFPRRVYQSYAAVVLKAYNPWSMNHRKEDEEGQRSRVDKANKLALGVESDDLVAAADVLLICK